MAELVSRRASKGDLPDLFLVDGGKGHLRTVERVVARQKVRELPEIIAIAKADEKLNEKQDKLYLPGRKNPIRLKSPRARTCRQIVGAS